ncbi:MAG: hypothetical protein CMG66_03465 [Candidatus Marinimicrobia bacterium]|nr:hypothetical protein [Candidatus Neomarinimicrobiota bacterium]|tara:strand:- start:264 stop:1154 length:891 start_codon:yes stop_codon:yes gene_type:complete
MGIFDIFKKNNNKKKKIERVFNLPKDYQVIINPFRREFLHPFLDYSYYNSNFNFKQSEDDLEDSETTYFFYKKNKIERRYKIYKEVWGVENDTIKYFVVRELYFYKDNNLLEKVEYCDFKSSKPISLQDLFDNKRYKTENTKLHYFTYHSGILIKSEVKNKNQKELTPSDFNEDYEYRIHLLSPHGVQNTSIYNYKYNKGVLFEIEGIEGWGKCNYTFKYDNGHLIEIDKFTSGNPYGNERYNLKYFIEDGIVQQVVGDSESIKYKNYDSLNRVLKEEMKYENDFCNTEYVYENDI